jgi:hypothetical protein
MRINATVNFEFYQRGALEGAARDPPGGNDFMTRSDVGTTERQRLTRSQRRKMWEDHGGICVICKQPIDPAKGFIDEHIRALALGGTNDLSNRGPAHKACAAKKTLADMAMINKAKAQKDAYLGIKPTPHRPIQSRGFAPGRRKRTPKEPLQPLELFK